MTKCGRYGLNASDFDYSPATVRASVMRSLKRLNTTYLDAVCVSSLLYLMHLKVFFKVYMHDVEFVTGNVAPLPTGNPLPALGDHEEAYGLAENQTGNIIGDGDRKFLEAITELRQMKAEGLIKKIGITGKHIFTTQATILNQCRVC
jgi:D-arabinose 1-dehydrogenase